MMSSSVHKSLSESNIQSRPAAGPGLWTCFLLPISHLLCAIKYPKFTSLNYKLTSICSLGLLITTCFFLIHFCKKKPFSKPSSLFFIPLALISSIFHNSFDKGIIFSIYSSFFCTYGYYKFLLFILRVFPKSFTFGEASICAQSILLLCYSAALNINTALVQTPNSITDISTLILQIGLIAIGMLCLTTYLIPWFRNTFPFYTLFGFTITVWILLPLHILLKRSPLVWIFQLLFDDIQTIKLVSYWVVCSTTAVLSVYKQIKGAQKASTSVRKLFHLLAIMVFVPGLLMRCSLLFVSSGVVLAIFIVLELLRILNVPPLGERLQDGFFVFSDNKDAGNVAMTAIYLLAGCSLPLWIHPAPCDVTDSAVFNFLPLLSGLFIVGIGDTAASFVGANIGKHFWKDSKKTVEGTIACILSQVLALYLLLESGIAIETSAVLTKGVIAVIIASAVEATTDQVDNIVLPFLMFIMLLL